MLSLRARLFASLLKNRHLFKFRLKPEKIDWTTTESILKFREECEKGASRFGTLPKEITIKPASINGIPAEWIIPSNAPEDKVILFFHGGGYVSGSCTDHRIHVSKFFKKAPLKTLLFEYRLAPEHQYPAAVEDSVTVYQWLLNQGVSASKIVFIGDSAGGGLVLATLLALKDKGISLPAAAAVLSPWTDLTCSGKSYQSNAKKCLSPEGTWTAFSKHYVGEQDPRQPWISPILGHLQGLPPLYISVGGDEILLDDSVEFARKAKEAGVDVTLKIGEGLFHCYPVCASLFPEATEAMDDICDFVLNHIKD